MTKTEKISKNELEFEKAKLAAQKFERVVSLTAHIVTIGGILGSIWLVFQGLQPMVTGQSPEAIVALARVVDAFNIGSVSGYMWGALATGAWWFERNGKKRAIREKSRYQQKVEENDPDRTSSGLTATGGTP